MGDAAHQRRHSAHNAGDAFDLTHDPAHGPDLEHLVLEFARQMRANPTGGRLRLIIWDRRIWSGPSWVARPYTGPDPHRSHAHLEVRHSLRAVDRPWSLSVLA